MDWRVLLTTFGVIFLAEMGDKTQLAAMTMAATDKKALGCLHRRRFGAHCGFRNRGDGRKRTWQLPTAHLDQARRRSCLHRYWYLDSGRQVLKEADRFRMTNPGRRNYSQ